MDVREPKISRALRAAIVATGLVSTATLSGCTKLHDRVVEGRGFDGSLCVGWSMQGSPRQCCDARGGMLTGGFFDTQCTIVVEGPFVPPTMTT